MKQHKNMLRQHQWSKLVFALLSANFIFHAPVFAQNNIETIVVSGSRFEENIERVPANIQVITKEQIKQSSSTNLAEVLQQVGNVPMSNQSGSLLGIGATPDIGGYGVNASSNTLVLVDGVRINPIDSSIAPLNSVPLNAIERIEITNGGASVQYGNNATGGVINIITKEGNQQSSQASLTYGSFGTIIGDASLRKRQDDTSLFISANSSKTNGWRENSDALSNSFKGRLTQYLGGEDNVFIEASAYHSQASSPYAILNAEVGNGNPYFSDPYQKGNGIVQDGSSARVGIAKSISQNFLFEMEASYGNTSTTSVANSYNLAGDFYTKNTSLQDKRQIDLTPRLKANWERWGISVMGIDYNQSDAGSSYPTSTPLPLSHVNLKNRSIYFLHNLNINEQFEIVGGVRRQIQDVTMNSLNNSFGFPDGNYLASFAANAYDIGLNYRYLTGQRLYVKFNQSYRFANTDEYYGYDPLINQPFFNGLVLRPQINKTYEAGGDFTYESSKLNVSIFNTNSQDEIRYDPISGNNINDAAIRRVGVNFNESTNLSPHLNFGFGARYQRAVYTDGINNGYLVSFVPQFVLNLRARYQFDNQLAFGGVVNYVGSQYYDGDQQNAYNKMPSYAFGDIYAEYRVRAWEARFTVRNVSNTQYAVYGNNQVSYGAPYGPYNYQPAPPRSFFVTLKYNFDL
jgi:iron complex outermembrane receptor protein